MRAVRMQPVDSRSGRTCASTAVAIVLSIALRNFYECPQLSRSRRRHARRPSVFQPRAEHAPLGQEEGGCPGEGCFDRRRRSACSATGCWARSGKAMPPAAHVTTRGRKKPGRPGLGVRVTRRAGSPAGALRGSYVSAAPGGRRARGQCCGPRACL